MSDYPYLSYPLCQDSYVAAFDDGQLAQQELKEEVRSWRSEGYAEDSSIQIFDHDYGVGRIRNCNDAMIDEILNEPPPQVRFILLLPTVHERIADVVQKDIAAADLFKKNELYDYGAVDPADPSISTQWEASKFNVSRDALFKILTKYDIAPAASSHIRGQEQIFGSRVSKDRSNNVTGFEFWYALRARAYFREVDKDADLKMTVVTKHHVPSNSTVVLLKYRSFNDLPCKLKTELIAKLTELVMEPSTKDVAASPFAVSLLHFNSTAQWYRRAARDPRDSVRKEEEKAHDVSQSRQNEINAINVRRLHLTMRNLDQDKLQLSFILGVIERLRKQHDLFYLLVRRCPVPEERDWLYLRVNEEYDRLENQLTYFRSSIEDVSNRAQRLLDLLFNLSGQQNARWSEKMGQQAMRESASMSAIAVVSMIFLPGTFICGILGTNVFAMADEPSGPDEGIPINIASKWWVLLATIVPLTFLTFLAWSVWRRKSERDIIQRISAEDIETGKLQNADADHKHLWHRKKSSEMGSAQWQWRWQLRVRAWKARLAGILPSSASSGSSLPVKRG